MLIKDAVYVYRLIGGDKLAWHGRYHTHDQRDYELHLFTEGQGVFLLNRSKYRIEGNKLFLTRPREFHSILPEALEKPISYYAILFESEADTPEDVEALGLINGAGPTGHRVITIESRDRFLMEDLYHLIRTRSEQNLKAAKHLILSMMYRWYGAVTSESETHTSQGERNEHVERALVLMEESIRQKLGTEDLASRVGLSQEYFIRLFRRELGMAPFQYFTRLKIEAASALLADTRLSMSHVATYFGFENPFHFSRVFKKCTGLSPIDYRKTFSHILRNEGIAAMGTHVQ